MRISKEKLTKEFENTAELFGKSLIVREHDQSGKLIHNVGAWELDHAPCYGGYVITEVACDTGAMSTPAGTPRRSAKEMSDFLYSLRVLLSTGTVLPNK